MEGQGSYASIMSPLKSNSKLKLGGTTTRNMADFNTVASPLPKNMNMTQMAKDVDRKLLLQTGT